MEVFYELQGIPVHSCSMLNNRQEALEFPLGELCLGVCIRCGFIANVAYDPGHAAYSAAYEDQQGFSGTFNEFARQLAVDLVDRYDLHGKHLIEIGCGKGDFLSLLCELGDNTGVGIDPACNPDRLDPSAAARIRLIPEYYSEKHAGEIGDMVLTRHTLEHIYEVRQFVDMVSKPLRVQPNTVVFIEVPDAGRVVRGMAFEDVYYEHCSYFSPGTLARLLRKAGYDVVDVALDYGNQYLLLWAFFRKPRSKSSFPIEEAPHEMVDAAQRFSSGIGRKLDLWRQEITRMAEEGMRPVIWGSGSKCVSFMTTLGIGEEIAAVVDINPHRHGRYLPGVGKEVMPPERLVDVDPGVVIVMNQMYLGEIADSLRNMCLQPELVTL